MLTRLDFQREAVDELVNEGFDGSLAIVLTEALPCAEAEREQVVAKLNDD